MSELTGGHMSGIPVFGNAAKRVVPWVLLAFMLLVVYSFYGQFQAASTKLAAENAAKASLIATPTANAAKAKAAAPPVPEKGPWVVALTTVNIRVEPSASSDEIGSLKEGDKVVLLSQVGSWYKIKNHKGRVGWVTSDKDYTKVVK
jgi:uncharacterized protein YgiM (DUF1202 family)